MPDANIVFDASSTTAEFVIVVTEGPDAGLRVALDALSPGPALVGQSEACVVRLTDRQVSRRHVRLDITANRMRLTDLQSTNGTSVNGVQVVEAILRGGETVRLGQTTLVVDARSPETKKTFSAADRFGRLLGVSPEMRRLYPLCERLANNDLAVVIEGETGTGKELLAESLHEKGPRSGGPFVVFDCTAVSPSLVESELFGHERGAFTGAVAPRKGVFELAHGGTLLIDEIGDLTPELQPKLLRVLERTEVRRVGGERSVSVDVRVLAATRRDLDREVQTGRFRDDVFHRHAGAHIELPPLRRRTGDVALLAKSFAARLGKVNALDARLLTSWADYAWPGNVRELRNAVARHLALGDLVETELPATPSPSGAGVLERIVASNLPYSASRQHVLDEFESRYVEKVLAENDGNIARAAQASGIARRHFQRVKARSSRT